jgi:hypothetical protein
MKAGAKLARKTRAVKREPHAAHAVDGALQSYKAKRNFAITAEPSGESDHEPAKRIETAMQLS